MPCPKAKAPPKKLNKRALSPQSGSMNFLVFLKGEHQKIVLLEGKSFDIFQGMITLKFSL